MKRLVVLLIVLAGGLAAAAFAIPSNAATVNGASISQQSLNSDLTAIANSPDYQCYLKAEQAIESNGEVKLPTVDGAGQTDTGGSHPTVTTTFADNYLDTEILHQLILELAAKDHVDPTRRICRRREPPSPHRSPRSSKRWRVRRTPAGRHR